MNDILKGVNFPSYLFASLVAGYVMLGADLMLEGFLGLFGTYRNYIEMIRLWGIFRGYEDVAMVVGHTLNSVVIALPFVHPRVYRLLPTRSGLLKGIAFGVFWHILVLIVLLITASCGAKFMKEFLSMSLPDHASLFLLHLMWASTLGLLYTPPKEG